MKAISEYSFIFIILVFFAFGCASNKPETDLGTTEPMGEDAEGLFGVPDRSATEKSDEAEVLRLLGITKPEASEQQTIAPVTIDSEENLQERVSNLENQLSRKTSEVEGLKTEISEKDRRISELESGASRGAQPEGYSATGNFQEDYRYALSEYNNRNYKNAINRFEALLTTDPNNSLSDNCQYWIGECYYGLGNFNQAIVEFTKVFSFNKSNKLDDAQLKLGICYLKLGDKTKAREEFGRLISDYPNSEYVQKAEEYLSKL